MCAFHFKNTVQKYGFPKFFPLLYAIVKKDDIERRFDTLDWRILNWIRDNMKCPFLDFLMPMATALGTAGLIWLISAACLMLAKGFRIYGIMILAGLTLASFVGQFLLKHMVRRKRPCFVNEDVQLLVKHPKDTSFPSCHTLTSVASAVILAYASPVLGWIAAFVAFAIAFSRLYLYVHYPSDVATAAVLGIILGETVIRLAQMFVQ